MATLADIKRQIAHLEAEAARITKKEMAAAIEQVKSIVSTFGLTAEQLGFHSGRAASKRAAAKQVTSGVKAKRPGAGVAKYRDPKTGSTWTGFGRAPAWIASAKNRDVFLIAPGAASKTMAEASLAATPVKSAKATKKVVRKATAKTAASKKRSRAKSAASKKTSSPKAAAKKAAHKAPATRKAASKKTAATRKSTKSGSPAVATTAAQEGAIPTV